MSNSLWPHGLSSPWNSPGSGLENTGVVSHSLLQGIFQTQGLNPGLPHCRQILYQLSHQWSQKNTGVACHALLQGIFSTQGPNPGLQHSGRSFIDWATRESQRKWKSLSCIWLVVTPWTIQSMELSRSEYWSGLLFLLQGNFPTQESNQGILHGRWILYQLSYQGSPMYHICIKL